MAELKTAADYLQAECDAWQRKCELYEDQLKYCERQLQTTYAFSDAWQGKAQRYEEVFKAARHYVATCKTRENEHDQFAFIDLIVAIHRAEQVEERANALLLQQRGRNGKGLTCA